MRACSKKLALRLFVTIIVWLPEHTQGENSQMTTHRIVLSFVPLDQAEEEPCADQHAQDICC
jgi:hypothetical protein